MNSGAYTDNSPLVCAKLANRCFGPYRAPRRARALPLRVHEHRRRPARCAASARRRATSPASCRWTRPPSKLGIDARRAPAAQRRRPGEELLPGKRGIDADLAEDLALATDSLGWRRAAAASASGIAASDAGAHPTSVTMVRLHADGSASCAVGATELGQGSRTVLSQIVADGLGLPFDRVAIVAADTGVTTYERTTGASRTTTLVGRALLAACADARAKIRELASEFCRGRRSRTSTAGSASDGASSPTAR